MTLKSVRCPLPTTHCDDDDDDDDDEEEEDERNPFIVSDGHLSDDEGPDGGQPFLR